MFLSAPLIQENTYKMKKYIAEMIGTLVLVLLGCGSAVFAGTVMGTLGVAFAFGLAVVAMAYTIGGISGCHINPAITFGAYLSKRISGKDAAMYMLFQVMGAILGSAIIYGLLQLGKNPAGFTNTGANGFKEGELWLGFAAETIFTAIFVFVVLGTTSKKGAGAFAGLAIGLSLVLIHIVCIPITGTSVNPARSIGPALFECGDALKNLWVFIAAPLLGGAIAAFTWRAIEE